MSAAAGGVGGGAQPPVVRSADDIARALRISREAAEFHLSVDVVDLHVDQHIWGRLLGLSPHQRLRPPLAGWLLGHADLPRLAEGGVDGAVWVVTTNPARPRDELGPTGLQNLRCLRDRLLEGPCPVRLARTAADFAAARATGAHAAWLGVQGGNALGDEPERWLADAADALPVLVTVMHLTPSFLGAPSTPGAAAAGLTREGHRQVEALRDARVFVDLAHASEATFRDALAVRPRAPIIVSHTGVRGGHRHWRNLSDGQLRAVADAGGVVGVLFHGPFLGARLGAGTLDDVVRHLDHARGVIGAAHLSLGSDWDGFIVPVRELRSAERLPLLTERLLRRGWSADEVTDVLGRSFLRALTALRG